MPASLPPPLERLQSALILSALGDLKSADQIKPFGAALDASGKVTVGSADGANLWEVLLNLKHALRRGAAAGEIRAAGFCVQNLYEDPETRKTERSLQCFLETADGEAARCNVPYRKGWFGKVKVEYADTAFGQRPIIFNSDPGLGDNYFSDQHLRYSLATELIDPYIIYQDRPRQTGRSPSQMAADIDRGIDLLNKVIEVCPTEPGPLFMLAKAHQALGTSQGEYQAFVRLRELLPENPDVANELSHACLMLGRVDEAVVAADDAVRLSPGKAGSLANLALAYLIAARHSDAAKAIAKSLKIDPSDPTSKNLLMAIRAIVEKKWRQPCSIQDLNQLVEEHLGNETR